MNTKVNQKMESILWFVLLIFFMILLILKHNSFESNRSHADTSVITCEYSSMDVDESDDGITRTMYDEKGTVINCTFEQK